MRILILVAVFSLLPFSLSAAESDNDLFEQAKVVFSEASQAEPADSLEAYRTVREILDRIVDDFPTSDLAVRILLSETISGLDVAELDAFIAANGVDLDPPVLETAARITSASEAGKNNVLSNGAGGCAPLENEYVGNLNHVLLTIVSTDHTGLAKNYYQIAHETHEILANELKDIEYYLARYTSFELSDGTCLGYLTNPKATASIFFQPDGIKVQYNFPDRPQVIDIPIGFVLDGDRLRDAKVQASTKLAGVMQIEQSASSFPTDPKERVRMTQDNLNRLGCAAGSPDGVVGRKTGGALSRYLVAKDLSSANFELGSDELLSILIQDSGIVCEPVPITAISFGTLKGNWSFRSTCGLGSKPAKPDARGTLKLHTQMADGRLYGILRSVDGFGGQLWLKTRGRQFTARVSWPLIGRDNFGGGFADDARSFSGKTSNGCRISFWKS